MKSLNKYVPILVFLLGLGLLIFSVRAFFHPTAFRQMTPLVNKTAPKIKSPSVEFKPLKKAPPLVNRTDTRDEMKKILRRPAEKFLNTAGLSLNLPDGLAFVEETDGPVHVLIGASEAGHPDFYLFSTKGKYKIDRAEKYLKDYFADEFTIAVKGNPEAVYSRGSVSELHQIRGQAGRSEFQAYYFTSHKASRTHLLVLLNRKFLKAPARVRELVDSIKASGH